VNSNGWLMAGTTSNCGTLDIGGALTIEQGARLAYRFDIAGSNDTINVSGEITFPSNGVVQVSALTEGATAPAKDIFLSSTESIIGPADLSGWSVEGINNSSLQYSNDRTKIYFSRPSGTLLMIR